jgi:hypothetical protein
MLITRNSWVIKEFSFEFKVSWKVVTVFTVILTYYSLNIMSWNIMLAKLQSWNYFRAIFKNVWPQIKTIQMCAMYS